MTHVIVGAGPAGVVAADTLRKEDPTADVLLIGDEPEPPYSRMAIPYYLTGMIGEEGTHLRQQAGHYEQTGIRYRQGRVAGVDTKARQVRLEGGETVAYETLLLATGSHPIKPPIEGLDQPGVHHCWTLEDARAIARLAEKGAHVVLMGAGFIGCIILEALAERGVRLTVVEAQDRMVPRMMNATAGGLLKRWCGEKGVTVLTSTRVTKVEGSGGAILKVNLDNGEALEAHLVVVATGVAANTGFLEGSGIELGEAGGIRVDHTLKTSVDGVYAAGDCAEGPDFSTGGWSVHAIQPTAADHGRIAALNMLGRQAAFKGSLNMNVLDTVGLVSTSFGNWQGVGGDHAETLDEDGYRYIRLEFDGDKLVGAMTLGRTDHVGVIRGLIQTEVPLGVWKRKLMEDPHRLVEAYIANTQ